MPSTPLKRTVEVETPDLSSPKQTRRRFLKTAGVALGATAILGAGLSYASRPPANSPAPVDTPEFTFGQEDVMGQRLLVAYATSTGSTVGVAAAIGERLGARGLSVEVKPIQSNPCPADYQAVVVGSAVHGAQWLPEAVAFVRDHQAALNRVPVAVFCVHIMNLGADEQSLQKRQAYLKSVRALVTPREEAYFAGRGLDPATASGFERFMAGLFNIATGDQRDWNKIRAWGDAVSLLPLTPPGARLRASTL